VRKSQSTLPAAPESDLLKHRRRGLKQARVAKDTDRDPKAYQWLFSTSESPVIQGQSESPVTIPSEEKSRSLGADNEQIAPEGNCDKA
jgi:hypothetical protein